MHLARLARAEHRLGVEDTPGELEDSLAPKSPGSLMPLRGSGRPRSLPVSGALRGSLRHASINFSGNSPAIVDLELESRYGYRIRTTPVVLGTTHTDGTNCLICYDPASTAESLGRHAAADGETIFGIQNRVLEKMVEMNELAFFSPHPDVGSSRRSSGCAATSWAAALRSGVLGAFALSRLFSASVVVGGTKALAAALFRAAARSGAQFRAVADVVAIRPAEGELTVGCRDGREFRARAVVSTLDPKTTFLELLEANVVPDAVRQAAQDWRLDPTGPFTAHFGIKGEPPRLATDEASRALVRVVGFEDAAGVGDLLDRIDRGELPDPPAGHLSVTTLHDRTQAAPGYYGPLHTLRFEALAPLQNPAGP